MSGRDVNESTEAEAKHVPVGIYWDIDNCPVPLTRSASSVVHSIRRFIERHHPDCAFAKDFFTITDIRRLNPSLDRGLNKAGLTIIHVDSSAKNAADDKLQELIYQFVDSYADKEAFLVVITGDINFSKSLRLARSKNIIVVLICPKICCQELKNFANHCYIFDDVIEDAEEAIDDPSDPVYAIISNISMRIPANVVAKDLFRLLANCGGKPIKYYEGRALIRFGSPEDALRAQKRFDNHSFKGTTIAVELIGTDLDASNSDFPDSPDCWTLQSGPEKVPDDRRSVIKGLETKDEADVTQLVRDMVRSWNDSTLSPDLIVSVERNTKQSDIQSDLRCNLFVVAVSADASKLLVKAAKQYIRPNSGIKWTPYKHKFQTSEDCKSVIKGLDTRGVKNLTGFVRRIVDQWEDPRVKPRFVESVERNHKERDIMFDQKCNLFVTATTPDASRALVRAAKHYFRPDQQIRWTPYEKLAAVRSRHRHGSGSTLDYSSDESQYSCVSTMSSVSQASGHDNGKPSDQGLLAMVTGVITHPAVDVKKQVRKMVNEWKDSGVDGNCIESVERDENSESHDGKTRLIVKATTADQCKQLIAAAANNLGPSSGIEWSQYKPNSPTKVRHKSSAARRSSNHSSKAAFSAQRPPLLPTPPNLNQLQEQYYRTLHNSYLWHQMPQLFQVPNQFYAFPPPVFNPFARVITPPGVSSPTGLPNMFRTNGLVSPATRMSVPSKMTDKNGNNSQAEGQSEDISSLSIVTGLPLNETQDMTKTVRKFVLDWNDRSVNGNYIRRVYRDLVNGQPVLVVVATNSYCRDALVTAAVKNVGKDSPVRWTRYPSSESKTISPIREKSVPRIVNCNPNHMFVITGIKSRTDDDVLEMARQMVADLAVDQLTRDDISMVSRDSKWKTRDGQAMLFVTASSVAKKQLIMNLAADESHGFGPNVQIKDYNGFKH